MGLPRLGRTLSRRALLLRGLGALAGLLLLLDLSRPPASQWSARGELALIGGYRERVSPWLSRGGVRCRFEPSCSRYAEAVIRRDGALLGSLRAAWRVARCGPWTAAGTVDRP